MTTPDPVGTGGARAADADPRYADPGYAEERFDAVETRPVDADGPPPPARPLSDVLKDLSADLSTLFRQEVALAKAEIRQEARKAGQAAVVLVGAALLGLVGLLILAMSLGYVIANIGGDEPAFALGFFLAAVVFFVAAAIAGVVGRNRLQQVDPAPRQTMETLQEDREFAGAQAREVKDSVSEGARAARRR